jgi:mRNA interferase RelE/StbE
MYEIIFRSPAKRFLKKLDSNVQEEMLNKIEKLKNNPELGKPLVGNLSGLWKLRYDKYRIIYQIKKQELIILVLNIVHRKNIYD